MRAILWHRAGRHHYAVQGPVEVAHVDGVALVAYQAPIGCMALAPERMFVCDSVEEAKAKALAHLRQIEDKSPWAISERKFRDAYGV